MSILGTSIAAGLANTAAQAQQVARQRDHTDSQTIRDATRLHELVQAHMDALEEGEELQSSDEVRISDQSQHQSPDQETPEQHKQQAKDQEPETPAVLATTPTPPTDSPSTLYRHIDVQA